MKTHCPPKPTEEKGEPIGYIVSHAFPANDPIPVYDEETQAPAPVDCETAHAPVQIITLMIQVHP